MSDNFAGTSLGPRVSDPVFWSDPPEFSLRKPGSRFKSILRVQDPVFLKGRGIYYSKYKGRGGGRGRKGMLRKKTRGEGNIKMVQENG